MPMKTIEGYSKEKYTNTSVLLAGGGAKALSDFVGSLSWDSTNKKIKYTPVGGSATDLVTLSWDNIANKPTSLPANGGDADTVDNKHASDFATAEHTHSLGNKPASDLSSTYPSGISVGGIYDNGYPFTYGCTITASGNGGYFQIAGQWNPNVTGDSNYDFPTEMYIRGRRDSYDVWTTWTRVLTDRNYTNVLDNRYYTETEADNRFVNVTGDTITGSITMSSGAYIIFDGSLGAGTGSYHAFSGDNLYLAANKPGQKIYLESTYQSAPYFRNQYDDYVILHSGNYTSYAASASHTHSYLEGTYNDVQTQPLDYGLYYTAHVNYNTIGTPATNDNSNGIISLNRHPGNYWSQIGLGSDGRIKYRSYSATAISSDPSRAWNTLAYTSEIPTWDTLNGKPFNWSGQSGQPSWLWGSNDGTNYYVWDPSNFSVNYANSAGSAERARYLTCPDTRSSAQSPGDYTATSTGVSFDFKESSVTGLSGYSGVMTFRPYASEQDWTGGEVHQIAFLAGGGLYHRIGTSSWGSWERILTSSNWSSYISIPSVGNDTNYYPIRSYTSGLQISSYSGSTDCALFVPYATSNQAGVVSTEAQIFSGQKTFSSIRLSTTNFGGYLYFGDDSYAYLAELADDQLTINATKIFLGISGSQKYYIDGTIFRPVTANSTSSSGIALGSSDYRFTCGYFSDKVYAYKGFYESSDERLKNILNPVKVNLDDLSKLRKVYYLWKDRTEDEIQLGMIAQDVQKLYPELVSVDKETGYLSLAYDKLSVLALEAIDVLYKEHKKLKKHVDELEKLLINNKIY